MPHPMSGEEIRAFLQDAPRTCHLATVREDGRPHVVPIWFTVDDGDILFATSSASVKGKNLGRTGFAAVSVDESTPPFSFVALEGPVELVDDIEQVRHWAGVIAAHYMGADWAEGYVQSDAFPDDVICRLTPSHMIGQAALAGE